MTIIWQETRKAPSIFQKILADDVMKKRWRSKDHDLGYVAQDDKASIDIIWEFDYMLQKYK